MSCIALYIMNGQTVSVCSSGHVWVVLMAEHDIQ